MKIADSLLAKLMNVWPVARLATVSESGVPHAIPIVFVVEGERLYSPIDGKLKRGSPLKRVRNIANNPAVTILLDDYQTDWECLWWVRLDGDAELHVPEPTRARALKTLLLAKYPQYESGGLLPRDGQYLRINWCLGATWAQSGDPAKVIEHAISELQRSARKEDRDHQ